MVFLAYLWRHIKLHWRGFLSGCGVLLLCLHVHSCTKSQMEIKNSPLPKEDLVRITVEPDKHYLRIEQRAGRPIDAYLPDRPSTFEIRENGSVKITSAQYGFEHKFFGGVQISNVFRVGVGMDAWYWKRLDIGFGVAGQIGNHPPVVFLKTSYVVYNNIQVGVTFDNTQQIGALLTLRI